MKLQEIFVKNKENIDKVLTKLIFYYPDSKQFYTENILSLYNKFCYTEKSEDTENMYIKVSVTEEKEDIYFDVFGYIKNDPDDESYALEYTVWKDWLNYEVDPISVNNLGEIDCIVHCIKEMTFFGNEENMLIERDLLQKALDDIDEGNMENFKTYDSLEDFFAELGIDLDEEEEDD